MLCCSLHSISAPPACALPSCPLPPPSAAVASPVMRLSHFLKNCPFSVSKTSRRTRRLSSPAPRRASPPLRSPDNRQRDREATALRSSKGRSPSFATWGRDKKGVTTAVAVGRARAIFCRALIANCGTRIRYGSRAQNQSGTLNRTRPLLYLLAGVDVLFTR